MTWKDEAAESFSAISEKTFSDIACSAIASWAMESMDNFGEAAEEFDIEYWMTEREIDNHLFDLFSASELLAFIQREDVSIAITAPCDVVFENGNRIMMELDCNIDDEQALHQILQKIRTEAEAGKAYRGPAMILHLNFNVNGIVTEEGFKELPEKKMEIER